ncbi:MAG: SHOCT domain-containing protein [Clostridia bacterium]|nr:SHOCT domain-containing protein [Clostridia bacterium]
MEKKRALTFSAGIMNIVAYSIYVILTAYVGYIALITIALIADLGGADAELAATATATITGLLVGCIFRLVLAIVSIVMSAKLIKISKASVQDYAKAKSKIISVIVINFIIVAYGFISYITSGLDASMLVVSIGEILMFVAMLVAAILLIVDIKNNKKLAEQEQAQIIASASAPATPAPTADDDKLDKLTKLNEMKANGLISDEEYEQMKADLLK